MVQDGSLVVFLGAIGLGLLHGAEPGHGWPIAATYALGRPNEWLHGFVASLLLGLGHLVSSLAVVAVFFVAKSSLDLGRVDRPLSVFGVEIGGPVSLVAGVLLVLLGIREYRHGHAHGHDEGHSDGGDHAHAHGNAAGHAHGHASDQAHEHGPGHASIDAREHAHEHASAHAHEHTRDHAHEHASERGHEHAAGHARDPTADRSERGLVGRVSAAVPVLGDHSHDHPASDDLDRGGLVGIVWTAFVLGFVHEEDFEIVGLCLGSPYCLELMLAYALAVLVALVGLTMALIAGYSRYEERIEGIAAHFPTISAAVLIVIGVGFVLGLL